MGALATPWQSIQSNNSKIYTPPPQIHKTQGKLGRLVVVFEVGPPVLCGGHSGLPVQTIE